MTKKSPDKRKEQELKRIEDKKQRLRLFAAQYVKDGDSLREAAEKVGMSTFFVKEWRDRLLDRKVVRMPVKDGLKTVYVYSWKKGFRKLLKSKKPGPEPGNCPKT